MSISSAVRTFPGLGNGSDSIKCGGVQSIRVKSTNISAVEYNNNIEADVEK